jgi:hypothetical protein
LAGAEMNTFSSEAPFPERDSVPCQLISPIHHCSLWCIKKKPKNTKTKQKTNKQTKAPKSSEVQIWVLLKVRVHGFQGVFSLGP